MRHLAEHVGSIPNYIDKNFIRMNCSGRREKEIQRDVARLPATYEGPQLYSWAKMEVRDEAIVEPASYKLLKSKFDFYHYKYAPDEYWDKRTRRDSMRDHFRKINDFHFTAHVLNFFLDYKTIGNSENFASPSGDRL